MRYLHIITALLGLISVASCAIDPLECSINGTKGSDEIAVIGHITRFDEYDVATRSAKQGDEGKITSFVMAIFEVEEGNNGASIGDCIYFDPHPNADRLMITLDRSIQENGEDVYAERQRHAIYVFANMPSLLSFTKENTLEEMLRECHTVTDLNIPENGFPMIGSLGDTFSGNIFDIDNKELKIAPTEGEEPPTVNNVETPSLDIPMKALYAKFNFTIEVIPDQTVEGNYAPQFELESYTLANVPSTVDFRKTTNADATEENAESIRVLENITVATNNVVASGANKINFSFYLPENLLNATAWEEYEYPFGKGSNIRQDDLKYRQRYKVKLLGEDEDGSTRPATKIILSGTFRDHQSHSVDVDYTIHLGKNSYSDFNIERNCEYNNTITIRGILNSNANNEDDYISFDHRVNVEYKEPVIVSLRREVRLDSHYEIRPLRIRKNANFTTEGTPPTHVKIDVLNTSGNATDGSVNDWFRIERSYGDGTLDTGEDGTYITDGGASNGKRKYFTHDLITNTLKDNISTIVPIPDDVKSDECVWIYADECVLVGDGVRSGEIQLTYGTYSDEKFTPVINDEFPVVYYTISQRKLFEIEGVYKDENNKNNTYLIEYEEEYLHNFDSNEHYGVTDQDGMTWGLEGLELSHEHRSMYFGDDDDVNIFEAFLQNFFTSGSRPYYDFYIKKHDASIGNWVTMHNYEGYNFNVEIINTVNSNNSTADDIGALTLAQQPKSAIEYCLNKNKRDSDGRINIGKDSHLWYLPSIDEMEDLIMGQYRDPNGNESYAYSRFEDFQNKSYWSSQPSYIRNFAYYDGYRVDDAYGTFYQEDINYARTTKVNYQNGTYNYVSSGVTAGTYYSVLVSTFLYHYTIYGEKPENTNWYDREADSFHFTDKDNIDQTIKLGPVDREEGNVRRDSKARVRCIRRQLEKDIQ